MICSIVLVEKLCKENYAQEAGLNITYPNACIWADFIRSLLANGTSQIAKFASAPDDGPHVGAMNLASWDMLSAQKRGFGVHVVSFLLLHFWETWAGLA